MSDRSLRISRRKLLQITSVAPLSALLVAGTATDEEVAAVAKRLPKSSEDSLYSKAANVDHVPNVDERNFRSAVRVLFEYFAAGAEDKNFDVPDSGSVHRHFILDVAYEQRNKPENGNEKSGVLIARRSHLWSNYMHSTVACAYLCGAEFGKIHPDWSDDAAVKAAYATAYKKVEDSMTMLLERAKSIGGDTPEKRDQKAFGAGC